MSDFPGTVGELVVPLTVLRTLWEYGWSYPQACSYRLEVLGPNPIPCQPIAHSTTDGACTRCYGRGDQIDQKKYVIVFIYLSVGSLLFTGSPWTYPS